MKMRELLKEKRLDILRLADHYGAINLRVFGSVARGDETPQSDIDLLVDAGPKRTPFFPAGFQEDLEILLQRRVDVVTLGALHWSIRDRVLQEAKPL